MLKPTQVQDEQVQPIGSELMNAPNMDVTHKVEANKHQTTTESTMQNDPSVPSTIHQVTPQTSTQPWPMNTHNGKS